MHFRLLLVVGVAITCALLMPTAFLGAFIGFFGLTDALLSPRTGRLWGIDVAFLLLGLGGIFGFPAFLVAEFAPRTVKRVGVLRMAVLVGLAWGSLATLCLGLFFTTGALLERPSLESVSGPAFLGLSVAGYWSWRNVRRDA